MRRITGVLFALVLATMAAWAFPSLSRAAGDERILSYDSHIVVHPDGSMTVWETIKVKAQGQDIKHGIYRDFPTLYRDHYGNRYIVGFDVLEVLRDGKADDYHVDSLNNGKRVYVGNKDVNLKPGDYSYTLVYKTNRQLGFFADHDELYWNVTGNGWNFRIDRASATVELPPGVSREKIKVDGFTGLQGSKAKDFRAAVDGSAKSSFTSTRPLGPREGLTIVVSWPKGLIAEPTGTKKLGYFIQDNRIALLGFLGVLIVFGYYLFWWQKVGRDPKAGTIIPLYELPEGFSPAAMRYIKEMGYDAEVFTAAVINMAVKGYAAISEQNGVYTITRAKDDAGLLTPEEKQAADQLFGPAPSIEIKNDNHKTISAAIEMLKKTLKQNYAKGYFVTNTRYFVIGMILSLAVTFVSGLSLLVTFLNAAVVLMLIFIVIPAWRNFGAAGPKRGRALSKAIILTLFVIPFLAGEVIIVYPMSTAVIADLLLIALLNVLFEHLLKASTPEGRSLLDKIEGFKQFLTVAEKDRLNLLNPPERTPALFEKYLPYALALGVQQEWAEQFDSLLAHAGMDGQSYSPDWYSGRSFEGMGAGDFANSLGSSFSSAVTASSMAPGSSSGSDGSSGDGGGGGGGGGW